jgi:leader peptidase (prepilin peptidase) / N-methyltransferase
LVEAGIKACIRSMLQESTLLEIESIDWGSPIIYIAVFIFGCCVGSYLNAVIYRLPRGLSTADPKRSFCPICKAPIPFYRNIPIVTWVIQCGKCAECGAPIAIRYLLVEFLTGLVWLGLWWFYADYSVDTVRGLRPDSIWYPAAEAGFYIVLATLAIVVFFVDIEHLIIPLSMSVGIAVVSIIGAIFLPWHLGEETWINGLTTSVIGGSFGFIGLYSVVRLGKILFGKRTIEVDKAITWSLKDADEDSDDPLNDIALILDNEKNYWHELFFRKTDKLVMSSVSDFEINGEAHEVSEIIFVREKVIYDGEEIDLANIRSMSGKVKKIVIPREAMGMGDVHLLGGIGLALGYAALLPAILAACFFGILLHFVSGVGLKTPLPFGPSLILGALVWMAFGPEVVDIYTRWIDEIVGNPYP